MQRVRTGGMRSFFEPASIAVAGVSTDPNKLGSIIFANLLENRRKGLLKAEVFALNPAHDRIGNQPCYHDVAALPVVPELLIIAVPESMTVELVGKAARVGVKAAIIVTSGYAEAGKSDVEEKMGKLARDHGMRVLGPNTIGLVDTWSGVDSLFLRPTKTLPNGRQIVSLLRPLKGEIVIISQSGHLGEVIAEELAARGVGIRALVGTGNQLDVSIEDVIQYFADDVHAKVIAVYLEGLRDGRRFMQAATHAVKKKPLIVFKVGKTAAGAKAALTHTASLVGDYEVYRAAFRQSGIVEAVNLQELVDYSISLLLLPEAKGRSLAILTNAGGVGAIAADEAEKEGLAVKPMQAQAVGHLRRKFEGSGFISNAGLGNPIDLTASVPTGDFVEVTKDVLTLEQYDLGLVLPTHQTPAFESDVAARLGKAVLKVGKPVTVCVIGNSDLASRIHREFMAMGIPSYPTPERAVRALSADTYYPSLRDDARLPPAPRRRSVQGFSRRRGPVPAREVSKLLRSYGIREPKSVLVRSTRDIPSLRRFRFPVACKLQSPGLVHKSDAGGVILGVRSSEEVREALVRLTKIADDMRIKFDGMLVQEMVVNGSEVIIGGTRDQTFGPVVLVGLGGTYTELIRDFEVAVAPVTPRGAETMLARTKLFRILQGYRGGPKVGIGPLSRAISSFSRILQEQPSIVEMEVNPLMVTSDGVFAIDTRVLLG